MGVPLRRPAATSCTELFVPDIFDPTWLDIFRFCGVPELGACLAVSTSWMAVADDHHVWVDAYERTQRVDAASEPSGEGSLRTLIERPFGEDAIAWRVAVLMEDGTERHATGQIVAYNSEADAYLVSYDGEDGLVPAGEFWEQERRKRTAAMRHNPSLAGKSRFSFIAPPACPYQRPLGDIPHGVSGVAAARRGAGPGRGSTLRFPSWKQELESSVRNAPSRLLCQLQEHTDEVLFVVFSPCGTRLASCSRDLRTIVFRLHAGGASSSSGDPWFSREAVFSHQTAPCRAIWWPIAPYNLVAVSTEDAGWQGASKVEIWEILSSDTSSSTSSTASDTYSEGLPAGFNSRCIFQGQNRPFDIYAAIFPWPPSSSQLAPAGQQDPSSLCFLAGWAVFRENEHYVQWLNIWPGPRHPRFRIGQEQAQQGAAAAIAQTAAGFGAADPQPLVPLARLRLEGDMNYLHCLEVGPGTQGRRILAMTGSTPHLCDEIGLIDLNRLRKREEAGQQLDGHAKPTYDASVQVKSMGERVVLSAKWNQRGDFLLLNTRPYARQPGSATGSTVSRSPNNGSARRNSSAHASFEDLLLRPAPDLSTSMELLVLDAHGLDIIGVFDGHFAFTTKESPFLIFTDEWADSDFLASGGEDHRVYVWHRRHRRLIRRLCGHTEPVNAVSWNGAGLLASASDDHSIIIWAAGHTANVRKQ